MDSVSQDASAEASPEDEYPLNLKLRFSQDVRGGMRRHGRLKLPFVTVQYIYRPGEMSSIFSMGTEETSSTI